MDIHAYGLHHAAVLINVNDHNFCSEYNNGGCAMLQYYIELNYTFCHSCPFVEI